jgi:hypothetical protein
MTFQEYYACQNALRYAKGRGVPIGLWAVLATGAASIAASAALTWGTPASFLAGLALAAFTFSLLLSGQITATRHRQAYKTYRESSTSYTFTDERIVATSRYAECSFTWAAVDRVMELKASYLITIGNGYICIPKRNMPPDNFSDFVQLLRMHGLLSPT